MADLTPYSSADGETQLNVRTGAGSAWLTQGEIAEPFEITKRHVSPHAKNIFADGTPMSDSAVKESSTTAADDKSYRAALYNLDPVLAIGYRVRPPRGTPFRRRASHHLKQHWIGGWCGMTSDSRNRNPPARVANLACRSKSPTA